MRYVKHNLAKKDKYLDKHIFYGLTNLNNGFDAPTIKYFSASDFEIILHRIKENHLGITGIEPWKDGEFFGVETYESVTDNPMDPNWYFKAFEDFKSYGENLLFAATYRVPDELMKD